MDTSLDQVLLQHGQFVQSLARSLLRDAHLAEDVAQETWARFVERPPAAGGSLRHWLRTVTRHLASNARRREGSRARRDERAARPEALPAASEELVQGEDLRRVIEAVLTLDEPYRSTILARYYQGQDAQRIATQTGTPLATVRSREQRALKLLRERLERQLGGGSAWAVMLGRLLEPGAPAAAVPASTLAADWAVRAAWLAVGVAAVGVGWLALERRGARDAAETIALVATAEPVPVEPEPAATLASTPEPVGGTRVAAVLPTASGRASASTSRSGSSGSSGGSASMQASQAELRGRFVLPGGAPAVGATVAVHGWTANEERELQYGVPESWQDPSTTTDADGRFTLHFDPPRAFQFVLDAKLPGHAGASWRWGEILPGVVKDLGEVLLPVGGILEGRIVDRDGNEVAGEWHVYADSLVTASGEGRDRSRVSAAVEPGTGRFRLVDVWPGPTELKAYSRMTNWVRGTRATATSGEVVTADIVYTGPDNSRRITVTTSSRPFHVMGNPEEGSLRLSGPGIEPRTAHQVEGSASTYSFEDLPPGTYTLEHVDPRYQSWQKAGVTPGTAVWADLVGSSALALDVRGPDGAALERYAVRVAFRNVNFYPREFQVHDGQTALAGGLVRGMFAGDYTITVLADGLGSRTAEVAGLAPGETRGLVLAFDAQSRCELAGRVVRSDGTPVAGVEVLLLQRAQVDDSATSPVLRKNSMTSNPETWRHELAAVESDASGAFRFELPRPGGYAVQVSQGSLTRSSAALEVAAGAVVEGLELVLPRGGSVHGHMAAPAGASCPGLRAWACPVGAASGPLPFDPDLDTAVALGPDGAYALGSLPQGTVRVYLLLPEEASGTFVRQDDWISGAVELGTVEVLEGSATQADFAIGASFPGRAALEVRVNGVPTGGLGVVLRTGSAEHRSELSITTGADGRCELPAFPGTYSARVGDRGLGWSDGCPEQVTVTSAATTEAMLTITVASGALTCLRGGQPLANEEVTVLRASEWPGYWDTLVVRRTDSQGRLDLLLTPGEYGLRRGEPGPEGTTPEASVTWSSTGPLQAQVAFP
ncbi:MAG TPA: sigma-70 family RNA polymerase sigma factor [Planctomycetota bacterium]